jgi:ubiquitin-protein ligase
MSSSVTITKSSITRLIKDIRDLKSSPLHDNGIYYAHDDENMLKGYALIIGPSDTPYHNGYYLFELIFPPDYPHSPPKVNYNTNANKIRFNPNLYTDGKVCISILNTWRGDQWSSCQSIRSVLLTICSLFIENPLLNEPGVTENHSDLNIYNRIIEYSNIDIAILKIVNKHPSLYLPYFEQFYPIIKEHFAKNSSVNLQNVTKLQSLYPSVIQLKTQLYSMNVRIDYNELKSQFISQL